MIETERLILRPFCLEDAQDVFEYLSAPMVNCFADMKINSISEAEKVVKERSQCKSNIYFAVCLKETGKVIGEIFDCVEEPEKDTYSPCWMINVNYQNRGYAYEAIRAYFDFLFTQKSARRIYIYTEDYNIACQSLCEKLGMRKEGLFLEFISFIKNQDGSPKYENTYQYAILKKEWIKNSF